MRVAVVGAGAIGGFIAAALARSGVDVCVVARGAHLDALAQNGIEIVSSDLGPFTARVATAPSVAGIGTVDFALMTFKAHQWPMLLPQMAALAKSQTPIVTLQNGVPFWLARTPPLNTVDPGGRIGAAFHDTRVLGGVVHVSGHLIGPGRIHQSGGTRYRIGEIDGSQSARLQALVDVFANADLNAEIDPNIRETVWLKLVNNAGLNPVSALSGQTIRPMLEAHDTRDEVRILMGEAVAVGKKLGIVDRVDIDERLAYAARLADVKTSMLQDLEAHRPLELDPILGALVELGDRLHVPVTHIRTAYETLCARSGDDGR
ncbi:MAG TPA: 2-dehydropantoate 2-reductase [Candidatus Baltobacteraceae bacterium]|jgi:2-dehydropantoate 2-reductase|nr:2-dehydropantoate 2-reductase [Candidatus Baltobacteraceae bacterium]